MTTNKLSPRQQAAIDQVEQYSAHNYGPLPIVIASAEGARVTDLDGREYIDFLSAYSAVNFGHQNPRLIARATEQLNKLTLTSRAFYSEPFGPFVQSLAEFCGKDMVLPMNTGVEAVETAIKTARRWGYLVKGVAENEANIIVMNGNFHGRTVTVISFSNDPVARKAYAPFTTGFRSVPFGDIDAIKAAADENTVAVLMEPIQGEAGVIIPPAGFLQQVREFTHENNILMIADEIQSGLGRAGATFACDYEDVVPDIYALGKALGGGIMPVSAVVANEDILGVFTPGSHGSTFGGNPLACAIGSEVVEILKTGEYQEASRVKGARLLEALTPLVDTGALIAIRGRGLWVGLDVNPAIGTARQMCDGLMNRGILAKDTHGQTIRFAPPLMISDADLDTAIDATTAVLTEAVQAAGL